jgi:hypothetical protein
MRKCPVCGPARWKPYQQAKFMAGTGKVSPELLKVFALTAPGNDQLPGPREIYAWNEEAPERWEKFVRLLRAEFPDKELDVWKVWEKQARGALHVHGAIRGVKWIPMETFRQIAVLAGFGPRVQLEACKVSKGGARGLLGYFSKYLLKAVDGWSSVSHVITSSRGWAIDWKRQRREKKESSWIWVSERDALPLSTYWVVVDCREGSRVDILGPPG